MNPHDRILILSDTHLGHKADQRVTADSLAPLLENITDLVVNGDVAELREAEDNPLAQQQLLRLQHLCNEAGVDLDLLAGNHDPFLTELRYLHVAQGRILITHGDAFHPGIAPWSVSGRDMQRDTEAAHASLDPAQRSNIHAHLDIAARVAKVNFDRHQEAGVEDSKLRLLMPWNVLRVLRYWREVPDLAAQFAERFVPEAKVVVFGHSHHPGIWRRRGRLIINTGSYTFPGKPWAVLLADKRLEVYRLGYRSGSYHLADRPHASFDFDGNDL